MGRGGVGEGGLTAVLHQHLHNYMSGGHGSVRVDIYMICPGTDGSGEHIQIGQGGCRGGSRSHENLRGSR